MVKVWPTSDTIRKMIKHPAGNIAFHDEGPIDWPDDSFTHRRKMDGDITMEDPDATRRSERVSERVERREERRSDTDKR